MENGIGEVDIGEESFRGKLSCKRIGEMGLVARSAISEVMRSKEAVRGESTGDELKIRGRDCTMGEERIGVKEDTESDTRIVSDLGEGDGEIERITESTKRGEGIEKGEGSGEEMKGIKGRDCTMGE